MKRNTYSIEDVLQILANVGVKADCGACMEQAFTGATDHDHNCGRENPKLIITYDPMFVLWNRSARVWTSERGTTSIREDAKLFTDKDAQRNARAIKAPIYVIPAEQSTQEHPLGEA